MLLALVLMGSLVYPFASALLFGTVLAGALYPSLERLVASLKGRRRLAAMLLTCAVALLLVLPLAFLSVSLGRQVVDGIGYVSETLRNDGITALAERR